MSVRLDLYNDIRTKLQSIPDLADEGTISHIEIWNSQATPANIDEHKQFKFPKVFVEFEKANYLPPKLIYSSTNSTGEQNYICNLTLHVFTKHLTDETPSFVDKEPLMELIKYTVKGLKGTNYGNLKLISDDYDKDHGNVFESQLIFSCLIQETGIVRGLVDATTRGITPVDPNINNEYIDIANDL